MNPSQTAYVDQVTVVDEAPGPDENAVTVGSWVVSLTMHGLVLLLLSFIVYYAQKDVSLAPVVANLIATPPLPENTPPVFTIEPIKSEIVIPIDPTDVVKIPDPVTSVELPSTEDPEPTPNPVAKGRPEAIASMELGNIGAFMGIGANGGSAGLFGGRTPGGKRVNGNKFGGSRGQANAVEEALKWFARHQSPNGQWDVDGYQHNCTLPGGRCEPGEEHTGLQGDVACTGYALLCYLGAGYDHRSPTRYRKVVGDGIAWLLAAQKPDGLLGERNYEHAVAAMALAEAYAMSCDARLREPAQRAVDKILERQTRGPGGQDYEAFGWNYVEPSMERNDSSVSGWNVMALKSAKAAGLEVRGGLAAARNWLQGAWRASNPNWQEIEAYHGESQFPYTWAPGSGKVQISSGQGQPLTCVGLVACVFLGHDAGDPMLESMANWVMRHQTPTSYPCNTYYLYYNTMGMFQVGGDKWKHWNGSVRDLLVKAQRQSDDCFRGSWDYQGTEFPGHRTGRLLSTAYCCLSLEVYYRYILQGMARVN